MKVNYLFCFIGFALLVQSCGVDKVDRNLTTLKSDTTIIIDGSKTGLRFDGIGAISAGASSRLLYDYPEPERSQILDYLFKPHYGASLQILKIEIGSDMNSTDGSEASHMRTPDDLDCNRGYEWWLMKEARARNPDIRFIALSWGAPAWVDKFWTDATIDYILAWLNCARDHDLAINYVGGWNERGWDADWYIALDKALEKNYPDIQIIGADDVFHPWSIATEMTKNPALKHAVDIVGDHSLCQWRTAYTECSSSEDARSLGKPLWNAEHSSLGHDTGAIPLARAINRLYIQGKITGNLVWALVSAWYANLPIGDTGLLLAEWPWSGYYSVGKSIWVNAHTTQFVDVGWKYIDDASGFLPSGASFVTLHSPDNKDYTIVIETVDASEPETISFSLTGGLTTGNISLWSTNLLSDDESEQFVKVREIEPSDGSFKVTLKPGYIYTLSTTKGQHKGTAHSQANMNEQMPVSFNENFDGYDEGKLARYFSDINGGFETVKCGGGRDGMCYRQMVSSQPVSWEHASLRPCTVIGDPRWWGDYAVSADVLLEEDGYVELLGRVAAQFDSTLAGYHLQVNSNGEWKLYSQDFARFGPWNTVLTSGHVSFKTGVWHTMELKMLGDTIDILIDNKQVGRVNDAYHKTGQVGLLVSPWQNAQFDNVRVTPTKKWPQYVPGDKMSVTATSEHAQLHKGYVYTAANAIDGRPETAWHTEWDPEAGMPQSITIDMGSEYLIRGLLYQPRLDTKNIINNTNGMITGYSIYISDDGKDFQQISSGNWPTGSSTKTAYWAKAQKTRYVKLEATEGTGNSAAAGEILIIQ